MTITKTGFLTGIVVSLDNQSSKRYNLYMSVEDMILREEIAREIEALPIDSSTTNALSMRIAAAKIARGEDNYMTKHFKPLEDLND